MVTNVDAFNGLMARIDAIAGIPHRDISPEEYAMQEAELAELLATRHAGFAPARANA